MGQKLIVEKLRSSLIYQCVRHLVFRYRAAKLASMSAEIAYYLILAFFPFLFFIMNLLSFTPFSNRLLIINFNAVLPNDTAALVKSILMETVKAKSTALLLLGMFGSLWATSRGMVAIIRGLNNSYQVQETRNIFKLQARALVAAIIVPVIIVFSLVMIVFGRILGSYLFGLYDEKTLFYSIWPYLRYGITLGFLFVTLFLIYRYLPNKKLKCRHLIPGAIFATLGWIGASLLFAYYVNGIADYARVYGSLGSLFALIIWLDITALVILLGGEINAMSSDFASRDKPEKTET